MPTHRKSSTLTSDFPNHPPTNSRLDAASSLRNGRHTRVSSMTIPRSSAALPVSHPTQISLHVRRKTFAGDMNAATRNLLLDFEEKVALLESRNKHISVELEATRDALVMEREERQTVLSLPAQRPTTLDGQVGDRSAILWERKLRMDILAVLKKVRTQNTVLSRSVREYQDQCESLSSLLDKELNFKLFEHNKLLVNRDLAFQRITSSFEPQAPAESSQGCVNDSASSEDQCRCSLRAQLNSAIDELHVVKLQLAVSQEKRVSLAERISSLQRQMSQCVDLSAQALEVERDLRDEISHRASLLSSENIRLQDKVRVLEERLQKRASLSTPAGRGSLRKRPLQTLKLSNLAASAILKTDLPCASDTPSTPQSADSSVLLTPDAGSLSAPPFVYTDSPTLAPFPVGLSSDLSYSDARHPLHSSAFTLTGLTPPYRKDGRNSVILAATLSRKSAPLPSSVLKTECTQSVNVINTCTTNHILCDTSSYHVKPHVQPRNQLESKRASAILADISLKQSG
ncbi:uncharacterized protein EV420DRAFT_1641910 [Desarmillaria tabescens]|uniref:Uncharacterized protein n=1 Tax=Armillaria tabescens TaxID=1929756 RepID=A0AA39KFB5_ARMTA|nr:uncharacterized protein EV420DRAFT_1641910 [Desarmillaria tabescens]KAK0459713.1 hypothetical protein EV420DRAFT_1641910 [Desarmillaria tabescens]